MLGSLVDASSKGLRMQIIEHGTILNGTIALDKPVQLPDGSKLVVQIETTSPAGEDSKACPPQPPFHEAFPFIGQWADRTDLPDSAEHVRLERAKWRQRPYHSD